MTILHKSYFVSNINYEEKVWEEVVSFSPFIYAILFNMKKVQIHKLLFRSIIL